MQTVLPRFHAAARTTPSGGIPLRCAPVRSSPSPDLSGLSRRDGPLDTQQSFEKEFAMKNTVILAGHVGSNPEVRTTQNGASITSLSLATTRSYKDGDGRCMTILRRYRGRRRDCPQVIVVLHTPVDDA